MPTPPSATKVVNNKAQFDAAVKNTAIKTIKLGANFTGNVTADRVVNVDLGGNTLTGNLEFTTLQNGTITLSNGTVTGTLIIDTKNASFVNNGATVRGTTTITNVAPGTFTNKGTLGAVTIADSDGTRFLNQGQTGVIDVASTGNVTLEGTYDNTIKVTGAATITVPATTVINTPMAIQANSTLISTNQVPAVIDTGVQLTVKENKEDAEGTVVEGDGSSVTVDAKVEAVKQLIAELPEAAQVETKHGGQIEAARAAYEALSPEQKSAVTITKLAAAEVKYNELNIQAIVNTLKYMSAANTPDQIGKLLNRLAVYDTTFTKEAVLEENLPLYLKGFITTDVTDVQAVNKVITDANSLDTKLQALTVTVKERTSPDGINVSMNWGSLGEFADQKAFDAIDSLKITLFNGDQELSVNTLNSSRYNQDHHTLKVATPSPFLYGTEGNNAYAWDRGAYSLVEGQSVKPTKAVVEFSVEGKKYTVEGNFAN